MNIEQMPFQKALTLTSKCKIWSLSKTMKSSFLTLGAFCEEKKLVSPNVPFACYYNVDWEKLISLGPITMFMGMFSQIWHFDCGIPVTKFPEVEHSFQQKSYPYQRVVSITHHGPYHKISTSYKQLYNELKSQGLSAESAAFELYLNDPRKVKPSQLETKILIPIH